jgi:NAD(P)H-dependent FMN reductase
LHNDSNGLKDIPRDAFHTALVIRLHDQQRVGVMKIFAISGSLRTASLNSALLRAVTRLAPADISVVLYRGLGELPLFNPDIEASDPAPVAELRTQILSADALLIASPEYAHGISGVMKNALDWMVGCEAFVHKPVALLNASPRAVYAQAALRETVTMMSACIVDEASITVPILGSHLSEDEIVLHPDLSASLLAALSSLRAAVLAARKCLNN